MYDLLNRQCEFRILNFDITDWTNQMFIRKICLRTNSEPISTTISPHLFCNTFLRNIFDIFWGHNNNEAISSEWVRNKSKSCPFFTSKRFLNTRTTDAQRSLFSLKTRTYGQTDWADKFWDIWGIFGWTILVQWVPYPFFPLFNHYFSKKASLYPHSKYLFGIGIWNWAWIWPWCVRSPWIHQ